MKMIENELKYILGNDYEETKNFFRNVISAKCPHKVFLTRRAYVLYKIFQNIIGNDVTSYGKIYNTHSLSLLKQNTQGKILIIDDIIVHGRTMNSIVNKLKEWGITEDRIVLWCICCNTNACNVDSLEHLLKHVIYVMPAQWEAYSDMLTKCIVRSNIGYISYVNSYKYKNIRLSNIKDIAQAKNYKIISNKADHFNDCSIEANIIWDKLLDEHLVHKFHISPCIRFYEKEGENEVLSIPYVFMPSVYVNNIHEYCCLLLKEVGVKQYPSIFDTHDEDLLVMFYKWTTNKLSQIVLQNFSHQYKNNTGVQPSITPCLKCDESYAFDLDYIPVPSIECDDSRISKYIVDQEPCKLLDNCVSIMESLMSQLSDISMFSNVFSEYIARMRIEDNERAKKKEDRNSGLGISNIVRIIKEKLDFSEDDIWNRIMSDIISAWDCGKCAYVIEAIETDKHNKVVTCLIRHGEQAFREYYALHKKVYNAFYSFFTMTHEVREQQLYYFAKYMDDKYGVSDFSRFVHCLDLENYYADIRTVIPDKTNPDSIIPVANIDKVVSFYVNNEYKC